MIYAVKAEGTGFVKIGYAHGANLTRRLDTLQTGCPLKLTMIAKADGDRAIERQIHLTLIKAGLFERGEWFRTGPRLDDVIHFMRRNKLKEWLTGVPADVIEIRRHNRHRRLGAVLEYADRITAAG